MGIRGLLLLAFISSLMSGKPAFAQQMTATLVKPTMNQINAPLDPFFDWDPIQEAFQYQLTLSFDPNCSGGFFATGFNFSNGFATQYKLEGLELEYDRTYYYCVDTWTDFSGGSYRAVGSFRTRSARPVAPVRLSLSNLNSQVTSAPITSELGSSLKSGSKIFVLRGEGGEEGSILRVYQNYKGNNYEIASGFIGSDPKGYFEIPIVPAVLGNVQDFFARIERPLAGGGSIFSGDSSAVKLEYQQTSSLEAPRVEAVDSQFGRIKWNSIKGAKFYLIYRRYLTENCFSRTGSSDISQAFTKACYFNSPLMYVTAITESGLANYQWDDPMAPYITDGLRTAGINYLVVAWSPDAESSSVNIFSWPKVDLQAPVIGPDHVLKNLSTATGRAAEVLLCGPSLENIDNDLRLNANVKVKKAKSCSDIDWSDASSSRHSFMTFGTQSRQKVSQYPCAVLGKVEQLEPYTSYCIQSCLSDQSGNQSNSCLESLVITDKDLSLRSPFSIQSIIPGEDGLSLDVNIDIQDPLYVEDRYARFEVHLKSVESSGDRVVSTSVKNPHVRIENLATGITYCAEVVALDVDGQVASSSQSPQCASTFDNRPRAEDIRIDGVVSERPYELKVHYDLLDRDAGRSDVKYQIKALWIRLADSDWQKVSDKDISSEDYVRAARNRSDLSSNYLVFNTLPYFSGEAQIKFRIEFQEMKANALVQDASLALTSSEESVSESNWQTAFQGMAKSSFYSNTSLSGCALNSSSGNVPWIFLMIFLALLMWLRNRTFSFISLLVFIFFSGVSVNAQVDFYPPDGATDIPLKSWFGFRTANPTYYGPRTAIALNLGIGASCSNYQAVSGISISGYYGDFARGTIAEGFRLKPMTEYLVCVSIARNGGDAYESFQSRFKTLSELKVSTPELESPSVIGERFPKIRGLKAEPGSTYFLYQRSETGDSLVAKGLVDDWGKFESPRIDLEMYSRTPGPREFFVSLERAGSTTIQSSPSNSVSYPYDPSSMLKAPDLRFNNFDLSWSGVEGASKYELYRKRACSFQPDTCGNAFELVTTIDSESASTINYFDQNAQALFNYRKRTLEECPPNDTYCINTTERMIKLGISYYIIAKNSDGSKKSNRSRTISFSDEIAPVFPVNSKVEFVPGKNSKEIFPYACGLSADGIFSADISADLKAHFLVIPKTGPCGSNQFSSKRSSDPQTFDRLISATYLDEGIINCTSMGRIENLKPDTTYCIQTCLEDSAGNMSDLCVMGEAQTLSDEQGLGFRGISSMVAGNDGRSVQIGWKRPNASQGIVRFEVQKIEVRAISESPRFPNFENDPNVASVSLSENRSEISNLKSGAAYCFRMASVDRLGRRLIPSVQPRCIALYDNRPEIIKISFLQSPSLSPYEVQLLLAIRDREASDTSRRIKIQDLGGLLSLEMRTNGGEWIKINREDINGPIDDLKASVDASNPVANLLVINLLPYFNQISQLEVRVRLTDEAVDISANESTDASSLETEWYSSEPFLVGDSKSSLSSYLNSSAGGCSLSSESSMNIRILIFMLISSLVLFFTRRKLRPK